MEQGWDPEVKKYFIRLINSISLGLLWIMGVLTAGIYYKLAYSNEKPVVCIILFYLLAATTLLLLIRYWYNTWKTK